MTAPVIGSLFSGYRGLDMAVENITGGRTAWVSDIDKGANKILAHHWPDVPNHGDITQIDFTTVEPVDILTLGFPCQDVSAAGKRTGLVRYGTKNRSGLWAEGARAINTLRPTLAVIENVRGLLSAKTDTNPDLLNCLGCMAHNDHNPMRALGAVLGDLAALGYDAAWHGVRASDIGACHQRFRVFIIAWPTNTNRQGLESNRTISSEPALTEPIRHSAPHGGLTLLKEHLDFGRFTPAVQRQEALTRPAPAPLTPTRTGQRLSPHFTEWMMGLPEGHITNPAIGLTYKEQIKACGNGVVPMQAEHAIRHLLAAVSA